MAVCQHGRHGFIVTLQVHPAAGKGSISKCVWRPRSCHDLEGVDHARTSRTDLLHCHDLVDVTNATPKRGEFLQNGVLGFRQISGQPPKIIW